MKLKYVDCHVHTNYSPDADQNATFQKYIERAKELGLEKIIFADHLDIDPGHPLFKKQIDYDVYLQNYNTVKNSTTFPIELGIEIGYQPHTIEQTMEIVKNYSFDYIILSIHYIDKMDFYTREYFENKTKKEAYTKYFDICLEAIRNTEVFDAFGHLDYIPRYSQLGDYDYNEFKEQIDEILMELIKRDKILEINASGFNTEKRQYPKNEVIKRYFELGGKNVRYGSDAHRVSELGRYFNKITLK